MSRLTSAPQPPQHNHHKSFGFLTPAVAMERRGDRGTGAAQRRWERRFSSRLSGSARAPRNGKSGHYFSGPWFLHLLFGVVVFPEVSVFSVWLGSSLDTCLYVSPGGQLDISRFYVNVDLGSDVDSPARAVRLEIWTLYEPLVAGSPLFGVWVA